MRLVLQDGALRGARLLEAISDLGTRGDFEPFRAALFALARVDRPESGARPLVEAIEQHRAALEIRIGRDPGISVAALDFLHELEGIILEPVFRETEAPGLPRRSTTASARAWSFDDALALEVRRGERFGRSLSLAILAPDGLASDGEEITGRAAEALREAGRDTDQVARLLPRGFGVILPCTAGEAGQRAAERLRLAAEAATRASWSAGVASCPEQAWSAPALATGAQEALGAARDSGGGATRLLRAERREHARRAPPGEALAAVLVADGSALEARIEDLSISGALLAVGDRIAAGSRVVVTIRETSVRPREVSLPSRVVRAMTDPQAGVGPVWRAGIAFLADSEARFRLAGILADLRRAATPAGRATA
jgi:GGDEF domain-containing protein